MLANRSIHVVWLLLMLITLGSALLAESGETNLFITLLIALSVLLKGRLVVERLMELRSANRYIRFAMNFYFYVVPALIVLVYLVPDQLASMTTLS
ncbi:cytochrome C oxidase subunit IV family protein [Amphritea sp. HPY]|uniref:cytochrome C oxidase subunit IV family protein n=1 Tax=Amphritea sp. HPY TaxID=3421652 RepID=UPI003D7CC1B5